MTKDILIVAAGSIGERHTRCFGQVPGVRVSLCESSRQLLNDVGDRYAVHRRFDDWNAVPLEDFYAVVICTPADLHVPMTRRVLEHGGHVLCEKPLALEADGVPELINSVQQGDRVAAVAYVWRCHPAIRALKAVVDAGTLGQIKQVVAFWGQEFPRYRPAYYKVYYKDHKTGGGALQDVATHYVNFIEWFMGPAKAVFCAADHLVLPKVEVEDTASLTLTFRDSPAIGTLVLNQFQKPNQGSVELIGTTTSARFNVAQSSVEVFDTETDTWQGRAHPVLDRDEMFITQAEMFLEGIEAGDPRPCSMREAFATLRTINAAMTSWRSGQTVRIDS